jgi:hypothetical protein
LIAEPWECEYFCIASECLTDLIPTSQLVQFTRYCTKAGIIKEKFFISLTNDRPSSRNRLFARVKSFL